jgi:hypothetical protein
MIYDWKDAIDALVMKYESTYQFEYILDEIKYWNTDEEDKVASTEEIEGLMNEEQIKREMLQWATERSI